MTRPDRHNPFRPCIQWKTSDFLSSNVSWISLGAHKIRDLKEVSHGLWLAIELACSPLIGRSYPDLVTRTVTDCFLQFLSLILSSQRVVTSLLFAHFCFTPSHISQRWIPTPWLTITQGPLFLFLSKGCHLFFSYALLWYYFSIVAVNKLPGSASFLLR